MSAARQRVLRECGCTGGGNKPNAVQRHTVRSLIDNRRATSWTVRRSGIKMRVLIMSDLRVNESHQGISGWDQLPGTTPNILYACTHCKGFVAEPFLVAKPTLLVAKPS